MRKAFVLLLLIFSLAIDAQTIRGVVVDEETGDSIPHPGLQYKKGKVVVSGGSDGSFSMPRLNDEYLTVSAVGYKTLQILIGPNTPARMRITLKPDTKRLKEVTVRGKKGKYSRKNNPAVELMKRVIAAKKRNDLENHDYYRYDKYQKLTLAVNDITPAEVEKEKGKNRQWLVNQIEFCPYNNKLILPLSVDETVTQHIYRKDPKKEKTIVLGQRATGVNDLIQTGEMLNTVLKDVFTDVDLYDDQIRLLQYPFTSPIGKDAIAFYRFYIVDTVYVDRDECYHLEFTPNNQQDFGFRGELWVLTDSTLHVKKCRLSLPRKSDVNFTDNLSVTQEFTKLPNGEWVLTTDDMYVEMSVVDFLTKAVVIRTTRMTDYAFDPIPDKAFKGKAKVKYDPSSRMRGDDFWADNRTMELTGSERGMGTFIDNLTKTKGFKYLLFGMKVLINSRTKKETDLGEFTDLEDLLKRSDIVTLHCPLTDESRGLINSDALALMKNDALLINCARGPIVNEEDLAEGLKKGIIGAAVLDVLEKEPMKEGHPLLECPNCLMTPHCSWMSREAREKIVTVSFENLKAFLDGKKLNRIV